MKGFVKIGGMPWPKTGATPYHVQSDFQKKGHAIKVLAVCKTFENRVIWLDFIILDSKAFHGRIYLFLEIPIT